MQLTKHMLLAIFFLQALLLLLLCESALEPVSMRSSVA